MLLLVNTKKWESGVDPFYKSVFDIIIQSQQEYEHLTIKSQDCGYLSVGSEFTLHML